MKTLQALEGEITRAEQNTPVTEPPLRKARSLTRLRRLLSPGQIMRFPTEVDWTTFKERFGVPEDAYDLIEHTDPLGFGGDNPAFYPDGTANPKNYLRRDQLPQMKIDMTSVYNPYITARLLDNDENDYFIPFLGQINEHYFPQVEGNRDQALVKRPSRVVSSLTPKLWTCRDAAIIGLLAGQDGKYISFVVNMCYQEIQRNGSTVPQISFITPPSTSGSVPQSTDCSRPTVGCFWFNDGKNGQIELPKDPACRVSFIVRFKKYVLL